MTLEWEELKRHCAQWIDPDALEQLVDGIKPGKIDNRTLLLELAHRFDRGERLGRALRVMNDYRSPAGAFHPMSSIVILGAVRFMFEAGGRGETPDVLEAKLRSQLSPGINESLAKWWADQAMGFFAYARSAAEVRDFRKQNEAATDYVNEFGLGQKPKKHVEPADDPSVAEARKWLRGRKRSLATNRFQGQKKAARDFVEALYAAGSPRVVIENINEEPDDPGAYYADSMVVHLPEDPAQRQEILRIINEVGRPDTDGGPITDPGTDHVGLWWD